MLPIGDVARWTGDVARSRSRMLGIGGVAVSCEEPGVPGSGGRGIEGGAVVGAPDLRVEACEPDLASAIAAASGERDSRLKLTAGDADVSDWRLSNAICC